MEKEEKGTENKGEANIYELGYLLLPTIPEENIGEEVSQLKDAIEQKGFIISAEEPEMKTLAYAMVKAFGGRNNMFASGYFGSIIFQTDSDSIDDIKTAIKKHDHLLRSLVIKRTKESLTPSVRKPISVRTKAPSLTEAESAQTPAEKAAHEKEIDKTIEELIAQ